MKRIFLASLIFTAYAQARWTVVMYMEPGNNLSAMATKNLQDLATAGTNTQISYAIQLHDHDNVALRYTIQNKNLVLLQQVTLTGNRRTDLTNALVWGFSTYPADKTMAILWGNGYGIIDPLWQEDINNFSALPDVPLTKFQPYRALLLNGNNQSYFTGTDLLVALMQVQTTLNGQKLSILGLDMCLGAMLEFAYQYAPYTNYLIGSENCVVSDSWDYNALGKSLKNNPTALSLVQSIGQSFATHYTTTGTTVYTQSGLDTAQSTTVKQLLDQMVLYSLMCQAQYDNDFVNTIIRARQKSPVFCSVPMYTDLYAFIQYWKNELVTLPTSNVLTYLQQTLTTLSAQIETTVVSNVHGNAIADVYGMSIYFPRYVIDPSYDQASFAMAPWWRDFLELTVARANESPSYSITGTACPS